MWKEFKEFAIQGNAIDLAVGVIIGAAFGKIVSSLVDDIFMPPSACSWAGSTSRTGSWTSGAAVHYETLAAAQAAGAPTLQHRALPERHHPVPDRRLRGLPGHREADEPAQEAAARPRPPPRPGRRPR